MLVEEYYFSVAFTVKLEHWILHKLCNLYKVKQCYIERVAHIIVESSTSTTFVVELIVSGFFVDCTTNPQLILPVEVDYY